MCPWQFMGSMSKENSFKLLDAFWEAGGNFIDTAVRPLPESDPRVVGHPELTRNHLEQLSK
jgi:hypothetical protein